MKVLIVEDTAKLAASLRSFLEMENNDVEVAEDLSEARHFVSITHFDMILLDIMLPDGDSRDFLRSLRAGNVNTASNCDDGSVRDFRPSGSAGHRCR